jgi:membrane peptidoglycan carboxypeptidase
VTDMRDDRSGRAVGGHAQRPQPGEGPDLGPRPYQAIGVPRHAQRATPDPEGTGVWAPNWDGDDEPPRQPSQRTAHGQQSPPNPRMRGSQPPPGTRSPRDSGEASTDFIPRQYGREQLFTHQEPGPPPDPRRRIPVNTRRNAKDAELLRRRRLWRRVRLAGCVVGVLLFLSPIVAFLIGYFVWDVPNAAVLGASTQSQIVTVYYSDGQTELAKLMPKTENRVNVQLEQVPKHVQDAVLAAEDRTYWSNPGFDPIGIGRAVFKQATGGAGGGSTITQQYVKVATQEDDFSLRRKFRELVWSIKISQQYSKEDILENYLNIVYFGRQAYGIQTASQAYFGKDVGQLTPSEGALLAGMIQSPSRSDPTKNRPRAEARWNFVLDGMASQGWIDAAQRGTEQFPQVVPLDQVRSGAVTDNRLHIQQQAIAELEAHGFDTSTVQEYGGKIVTTIDPRAQDAAVKAVDGVLNGEPPNLKSALVAVDPTSGAVRAYYGGNEGTGIDLANSQFSPGSSFKAFVMLAALDKGKGLKSMYSGSSPLEIGGNTFNNSESSDYGSLTLKQAMTYSVNTTFVQLTDEVGTQTVADAAHRAGIPETVDGKRTLVNADGSPPGLAIALGALPVRTLDMANAYATFAAGGVRHEPFLVAEYRNAAGQVVYKHEPSPPTNALDPQDSERNSQLACNVTESLLDVPEHSKFALNNKRPAAAKTGTDQRGKTDENDNSWTVGYTKSVSAAVWVGDPAQTALKTKSGRNVFGATFAGQIWKRFMDVYLEPTKASDDKFPDCKPIGKEEATTTAPPPTTTPTKPGRQKPPDPTTSLTEITRPRPPRTTELTCPPLLCPTTEPGATSSTTTGRG